MKINFKARQLVRSALKGYLSTEFDSKNFQNIKTQMYKPFSYSTFTLAAFDYDLSPILLLSDLSEHTRNIKEKNSASLMLCEERKLYKFFPKFDNKFSSYEDPMSRPRVTLIGKLKKTSDSNDRKRFISRHPASNLYANFKDMNFYKMDIKSAHLIGGFAQVKWFTSDEILCKNISNFKNSEENIISHMNSSHKTSIKMYINNLMQNELSSAQRKGDWNITGVDPDGFDLRKKQTTARYFFEKEISNAAKLRGVFVNLHKKASEVN